MIKVVKFFSTATCLSLPRTPPCSRLPPSPAFKWLLSNPRNLVQLHGSACYPHTHCRSNRVRPLWNNLLNKGQAFLTPWVTVQTFIGKQSTAQICNVSWARLTLVANYDHNNDSTPPYLHKCMLVNWMWKTPVLLLCYSARSHFPCVRCPRARHRH